MLHVLVNARHPCPCGTDMDMQHGHATYSKDMDMNMDKTWTSGLRRLGPHFLVRTWTEIKDAGIAMPALVSVMPISSYGYKHIKCQFSHVDGFNIYIETNRLTP